MLCLAVCIKRATAELQQMGHMQTAGRAAGPPPDQPIGIPRDGLGQRQSSYATRALVLSSCWVKLEQLEREGALEGPLASCLSPRLHGSMDEPRQRQHSDNSDAMIDEDGRAACSVEDVQCTSSGALEPETEPAAEKRGAQGAQAH